MHLPLVNQFYWMQFAQLPLTGSRRQRVYRAMRENGWNMQAIFELEADKFSKTFPDLIYADWHCADRYHACKLSFQRRGSADRLFPIDSPHYPERMRRTLGDDAPPVLYQRGRVGLAANPQVAVVGRRDTTFAMAEIARHTGGALADAGWTVAAGYESGIAEHALRGALEADGTVCAYPASGLTGLVWRQRLHTFGWQREHCLLSPFAPERSASEHTAAQRNQLLAANCSAVVLLEDANDKRAAGRCYINSVEAARWALEYSIPLFVLDPTVLHYRLPAHRHWIERGGVGFKRPSELVEALQT